MDIHVNQAITLTVNGYDQDVYVRNASTLLHTLREQLGLTGVKNSCSNGDCGSCTVLIDGSPFNACHILSVEAVGLDITTIEGLTDPTVQQSFMSHWALQCGYCTPGFILNVHALKEQHPDADDTTIAEWMDSNICRCTGYEEMKDVVQSMLAKGNKKHA